MTRFPVSQEKEAALEMRMGLLRIKEDDLEEQFVRSQGPGGQNVNKSSTCVVLQYRPTGLQVRCDQTRSQGMNRFLARRRLVERIAQDVEDRKTEEEKKRFKIRRQKKRRSRRTREKLRKAKEIKKEKKSLRQGVAIHSAE